MHLVKVFLCLLLAFLTLLTFFYWAIVFHYDRISKNTAAYIYEDISRIPAKKSALLLGTSKYLENGHINLYYKYRIKAALALYKSGKIQEIVVSGDNGEDNYDETTQMFYDLLKGGIPERAIKKDDAGFRTLDSIIRAEVIFDLKDYVRLLHEMNSTAD